MPELVFDAACDGGSPRTSPPRRTPSKGPGKACRWRSSNNSDHVRRAALALVPNSGGTQRSWMPESGGLTSMIGVPLTASR